jgi:hypothetical protein
MGIGDKSQIDRRYCNLTSMMDLLEPDEENKLATLPKPLVPVYWHYSNVKIEPNIALIIETPAK